MHRVRVSSLCRPRFSTSAAHSSGPTGSAKLFADAAEEEAESPAPRRVPERPEEPNWTGDERIEDTVRMELACKSSLIDI